MTTWMSWCQGCVSLLDFKGPACFWTSAFWQCPQGCSHVGFSSGTGHFWTSYAVRDSQRGAQGAVWEVSEGLQFCKPRASLCAAPLQPSTYKIWKGGNKPFLYDQGLSYCLVCIFFFTLLHLISCIVQEMGVMRTWETWLCHPQRWTTFGFFLITIKTMAR